MELKSPFIITSRLLPGLKVGGAYVQLQYVGHPTREGRTRYKWIIDLANGKTFYGYDLKSGCQGGTLQEGFESLLSFLSAFGEAVGYEQRTGQASETLDLFPEGLREWAYQNSDELAMNQCELQENKGLIAE